MACEIDTPRKPIILLETYDGAPYEPVVDSEHQPVTILTITNQPDNIEESPKVTQYRVCGTGTP